MTSLMMGKNKKKDSNSKRCDVCNIWIDSGNVDQHSKSKKHLKRANHQTFLKNLKQQICSEGILIRGIPNHINNETLVNHFKQFGNVVALKRKETEGLLQFKNRMQAQLALNQSHFIEGNLLTVKPRSKAQEAPNSPVPHCLGQITAFRKEFTETLSSSDNVSLDEQFYLLVKIVEITEQEKRHQRDIISSLKEWLSVEFPGSQLHIFGSSLSGLAFRVQSDIDIYIEISQVKQTQQIVSKQLEERKVQLLRQMLKILRSHPDISEAFLVATARVPVVKFVHIPTGIACDLSCSSPMGVLNSKLLYLLQDFDVRVRPLLYALKIWAKSNRLIGFNDSSLSSYAFTLLVLFYLQQTTPPVVPGVNCFQKEVLFENQSLYNEWGVSFQVPSKDMRTAYQNKESIINLLIGFFHFYSQLDSSGVVICPLYGILVPKPLFFEKFSSVFDNSKTPMKITSFTVQDPLELNFNVTSNFRHVELFQSLCKSGEQMCGNPNLLWLFVNNWSLEEKQNSKERKGKKHRKD